MNQKIYPLGKGGRDEHAVFVLQHKKTGLLLGAQKFCLRYCPLGLGMDRVGRLLDAGPE
jgi:hypothetical protein